MPKKVILDTDIGSDIDDAICLAYLLAQPECDLLGITTVSGQPVERARIASALVKAAGKDVPIFPGVENPILIKQRQPRAQQAEALSAWEHEKNFPAGVAIDFLRQTIRENPGEITLLAIGPMTNVGLLFALDPEIPSLLKELVMMVGIFTNQVANAPLTEWNALCDPHASAIIYNSQGAPVHRSVGLDVTLQVNMDADDVRQRFKQGLLRPVLDFAEVWFKERPVITFHDPLAATTLFDDSICTFERGTVDVELVSPRMYGKTYWQPGADGPHEVALKVDADHFFDHYFSVLANA